LYQLRCTNFGKAPSYLLSRTLDLQNYDREHNIETAGLIELDELGFDSPNKAVGTRYGGMTPWRMKDLLNRIPGDLSNHTFIDIGSGKGAALFQASDFPFQKIIGVEFSPELHEIAVRNIASFRSRTQKCHSICSVCGDAGAYEYPEGPWVLFFNTPFGLPVWEKAAENLARAASAAGGKFKSYLIYANFGWDPEAAQFADNLSFLRRVYSDDTSRTYEFVS